MRSLHVISFLVLSLLAVALRAQDARFVIHVSVDGLRGDAVAALPPADLPNFQRLKTEATGTDNARCDFDLSITLPNHLCQVTGRPVLGADGHNWRTNVDPAPGETLAGNKGTYVASAFDVVHDHGLRTAAYVSKSKFSLLATSWDATNGAPDALPPDHGRNKLDVFRLDTDTEALVAQLAADQRAKPAHYVFLHLADLDAAGHATGWDLNPGSPYCAALRRIDAELGTLFRLIDDTPALAGRTFLVLTTDHGGVEKSHGDASRAVNYTIPFHVWGPAIAAGTDLYALNPQTRVNPGTSRPDHAAIPQPIRNGEAGNVALRLLGLGPIPGSTIGAAQDLAVGR